MRTGGTGERARVGSEGLGRCRLRSASRIVIAPNEGAEVVSFLPIAGSPWRSAETVLGPTTVHDDV